jgi:hypothetical protein
MAKTARRPAVKKNGTKPKKVKKEEKEVSELGRILRKLAEQYEKSGGKLLSIEEVRREVRENRCG